MRNFVLTPFLLIVIPSIFATEAFGDGTGGSDSKSTSGPEPTHHNHVKPDTRTLDELYELALKEGGKLIVYAGGDTPGQLDAIKAAFQKRFPEIKIELIVDFSKNHNARIDNQIATNTLVPDVTHLQTLQDFPRWKKQGILMPYKPNGWDAVFPQLKDSNGYYTSIAVVAFSNNINKDLIPNRALWPTEANDYLRPDLKGKVVSTYPNDDDAVLFWYKQVIDKYGWTWLEKFLANEPKFVRGTQYPSDMVWNGTTPAVFTTAGYLKPKETKPVQFVLPRKDPFMSWAQRGAILKHTKRPNAAKLYMSWWLDVQTQRDVWYMWSVRKDVPIPDGYRSIFDYKGQTDILAFPKFLEDRAAVERFRSQITLYVGEVEGSSPAGVLGPHPTKDLRSR